MAPSQLDTSSLRVTRLNLGAGSSRVQDYLSIDADPHVSPDISAHINALPCRTATIDEIIAYHVIEHVNYWEAETALAEWYRVLRPGGSIAVECPNIERVTNSLVASSDYTKWSQMGMWGVYGDPNHKNPFYSHKWGYTPITLAGMLYRAGFTDVKSTLATTHVPERDLRLVARKPIRRVHPLWSEPQARNQRRRIFWFLIGGPQIASSRIHGHRIHHYLRSHGWESYLLLEPRESDWIGDTPVELKGMLRYSPIKRGDVAVFQKVSGKNTSALIEELTGLGVKTIFIDCDLPLKRAEAEVALWTICTSAYLTNEYRKVGIERVVYLPDPVEHLVRHPLKRPEGHGRIRCIWFGNWSPERAQDISMIRDLLAEKEFEDFELRVVTNGPDADAQWDLETIGDELALSDIAVVPIHANGAQEQAKSSNRVTQAMAAGLPVIASDLPAYHEAIENGWNGYLCVDAHQWRAALRAVRQETHRRYLAENARIYGTQSASIEVIGRLWEIFFANLADDNNGLRHRTPSFVTLLAVRRTRAILYEGIAVRAHGGIRRMSYLACAWWTWPFSPSRLRMTIRFALRASRRLFHRLRNGS